MFLPVSKVLGNSEYAFTCKFQVRNSINVKGSEPISDYRPTECTHRKGRHSLMQKGDLPRYNMEHGENIFDILCFLLV